MNFQIFFLIFNLVIFIFSFAFYFLIAKYFVRALFLQIIFFIKIATQLFNIVMPRKKCLITEVTLQVGSYTLFLGIFARLVVFVLFVLCLWKIVILHFLFYGVFDLSSFLVLLSIYTFFCLKQSLMFLELKGVSYQVQH